MTHKNSVLDSLSEQSKKFIDTARAIGCDEDEDAFKERLGKLLSAPAPTKDREAGAPKGKAKQTKEGR